MRALRTVILSLSLLTVGLAMEPTDARACGGCFTPSPPQGSPQVVTDHRMVLSLSSAQTTLWDQFQYSGSPEEFSWVLPIRYTESTRVQLASDDFMNLVSAATLPTLRGPTPPPVSPACVPPPSAFGGYYDAAVPSDAPAPSNDASDTGVTVLREEVVGPYAVVILRGTSGMGLREWLTMNGYAIPTALGPTLDHYLGLSMDFIALRLRAGKGLNRMVPVRVTVDGYQARLPLRMIAAGVADRVGLALTVFAPSRVEAMNFPNGELSNDDFTWDWANPPVYDLGTVFVRTFDVRNRANGERLWLTEASLRFGRARFESQASSLPRRGPLGDPDAGPTMTVASPVDDVRVAFAGLGAEATITRMRADLPARMLDRDLELAASSRGERYPLYEFGRELNRPQYSPCPFPLPADDASGSGADGVRCSVALPGARGTDGALALGLALGAFAARRRRRS